MIIPENLTQSTPEELYQMLDELTAYRKRAGRGRSPEAAHVRDYCASERVRIKRELKARHKPLTCPNDPRTYGPGQADWQRAAGCRV